MLACIPCRSHVLNKLPAIVFCLAVSACDPGPAADSSSSSVDGEITELLVRYDRAISERDAASILDIYVDDDRFTWIEEGAVRYRSPADALASLASFPAGTEIHTEYSERSIRRIGDRAALVHQRFHTTVAGSEMQFEFGGVMTVALERQESGWHIVSGHVSSARPDAYQPR